MSEDTATDEAEPDEVSNCEMSVSDWRLEFQTIQSNPPIEGDFLFAEDEDRIKLEIDLTPGKPPFIFSRLYLPNMVGKRPQWRAVGLNPVTSSYRWKLILAERSRDEAIRRCGILESYITCKCLRVIRHSHTGKSIVVEVVDW